MTKIMLFFIFITMGSSCAYENEEELFGAFTCPDEISYTDHIKPILSSKCVIPQCHDGVDRSIRNFTIFGIVRARAGQIKQRINDYSMPPSSADSRLTSQEIDIISCWVDAGAPSN
ncbi:MAG: hypothetical protein DHS20C17_15390 [Cyclobacteriaceae bacterium]|nr:MAG: hypothetical protein DHS20C17_15390 [Cyclobacteriaceae bacterium]